MSPFELTLVVSIVILALYAASGISNFKRSKSFDSFFLADRILTTENVRNTFAGAAISISTVLVFFLTLSIVFGWQIFISPLTLAFGVLIFAHVIYPKLTTYPELFRSLKGEGNKSIDSLGDLMIFLYGNKSIGITVTLISGIGVLAVLIAEMMVGVTIYQEYFIKPEYLVFLVAGTLFIYAGFGGLRSVVQTDRWQVRLILFSMGLVVVSVFVDRMGIGSEVVFNIQGWRPVAVMPLALIVNMVIINLCFMPSSLRVWQVVSASSKGTGFKRALWGSTGIITLVLVCAVLISKIIFASSDQEVNLQNIFAYLSGSNSMWIAYIVYPLFIGALLSALVSTADSAILPLAQALTIKKNGGEWKQNVIILKIFILISLVVTGYFLVTLVFDLGLVAWILTVFSVTTCIAPTVILPLFTKPRNYSKGSVILINAGMIIGCALAFVWSVYFKDDITIQPWNCVIGIGISGVCTIAGCLNSSNSLKVN